MYLLVCAITNRPTYKGTERATIERLDQLHQNENQLSIKSLFSSVSQGKPQACSGRNVNEEECDEVSVTAVNRFFHSNPNNLLPCQLRMLKRVLLEPLPRPLFVSANEIGTSRLNFGLWPKIDEIL